MSHIHGTAIHTISARGLTASWSNSADNLVLENISFELNEHNNFLAVIGPVGAGKVLKFYLQAISAGNQQIIAFNPYNVFVTDAVPFMKLTFPWKL